MPRWAGGEGGLGSADLPGVLTRQGLPLQADSGGSRSQGASLAVSISGTVVICFFHTV